MKAKDNYVRLRLPSEMLEIWRRTADAAGLTLSEWIRIRCNGMEILTAPAPRRKAA